MHCFGQSKITCMQTYSIDIAAAIDHLIEHGMPVAQAKAVVQNFAGNRDQLATKGDLQILKLELKIWIVAAVALSVVVLKALDYVLPGVGL